MGVEHLVVLMLENRSFDNVLGFLRPWSNAFDGVPPDARQSMDVSSAKAQVLPVVRANDSRAYVTQPDPGHEHADTMFQLFGAEGPDTPSGLSPRNEWFLERYLRRVPAGPNATAFASAVLSCFDTHAQLPAIAALADNFVVFDRWFSSMPGPTWPNRWFAHAATSNGIFLSPSDAESAWSEIGTTAYGWPTIFDRLEETKRSWAIYYHDVPQALSLASLHRHRDRLVRVEEFYSAARAGRLPQYSFIEPAYFDCPAIGAFANDMHPPHDVRRGDQLVADVYNALRSNAATWSRVALLIVWDEHGGFYDHVPPPSTLSPDDASMAATFKFRHLGVRVPAILVSPWVRRRVVHETFEHASIPATVRHLFGTGDPLNARDALAQPFDVLFECAAMREDTPAAVRGAMSGFTATPRAALPTYITQSQRDLLALAAGLPSSDSKPVTNAEDARVRLEAFLRG